MTTFFIGIVPTLHKINYLAIAAVSMIKGEFLSQKGGQFPLLSIILPFVISFPAVSTPTRTVVELPFGSCAQYLFIFSQPG